MPGMAAAFAKALVLWVGILALAVLNGFLREQILIPAVGSVYGFLASGVILSICVLVVAWAAIPWWGPLTAPQYLSIGCFWLVSTLAFELIFGRFILHKTWSEIFAAYSFEGGNLWPVVLLCTLTAPWLAARVRGIL